MTMIVLRAWTRVASTLLLFLLTACGDTPTTPEPYHWGRAYTVAAARQLRDTVDHVVTTSIVVTVRDTARDSSRAVPGKVVVLRSEGSAPALLRRVTGESGGEGEAVEAVGGTTDSIGRFIARWELGTRAGEGMIVVTVESEFTDTVHFAVLPGRAHAVRLAPVDTALYIGNSYTPRVAALDRHGNQTTGSSTVTSRAPATASVVNGSVTGSNYGNAWMLVTLARDQGPALDSAEVAVVPRGTLAARIADSPAGVVVVNLDWSGYRKLADVEYPALPYPSWTPNGTEVLFGDHYYEVSRIYAVTMEGVRRSVSRPQTPLKSELYPRVSADGQWLYFSGGSDGWPMFTSWRMSIGGNDLPVHVGPAMVTSDGRRWKGSPSHDGTSFTYRNGGGGLQVVDLVTGAARSIACERCAEAEYPRYSPDGTLIAFTHENDYGVSVVRPDGTGYRRLATGFHLAALDWSPDGNWLITRTLGRLKLIRVADATAIHLPRSAFTDPSWRPGS